MQMCILYLKGSKSKKYDFRCFDEFKDLDALNTAQNTVVERVDEFKLDGAGSGLYILESKRIFYRSMFQINLLLIHI